MSQGCELLLWGWMLVFVLQGAQGLVPQSSGGMVWLGLKGSCLSVCLPLVPTAESESVGAASASLPRVLSNSPLVKNKGFFLGDKLSEMLIFFSEHLSHPGKLDQAVGGSVSRGMGQWEHRGGVLASCHLFPIHKLPWEHKSTKLCP